MSCDDNSWLFTNLCIHTFALNMLGEVNFNTLNLVEVEREEGEGALVGGRGRVEG